MTEISDADFKFYSPHRLESLTDGVFAIAMTIMVLNIPIPEDLKTSKDQVSVLQHLSNIYPLLVNYAISCIILGFMWITHQRQTKVITKTDGNYLWLHMISLLFVCLIPFSTSFMGQYTNSPTAVILFHTDLFIIGIIYMIQWYYATKKHHLVRPDLSDSLIKRGFVFSTITPAMSVIGVLIAFHDPDNSTMIYMACPFVALLYKRVFYNIEKNKPNSEQGGKKNEE